MGASGRAVSWLVVVGGLLLGWLGTWLLFAGVVLVVYVVVGVEGSIGSQTVVGAVALLVVPMASASALVSSARRTLGHRLLLGVAIGSMVGSGVCAASVLPGV